MARTPNRLLTRALPAGRRARERAAGQAFRLSTRLLGLRPELVPQHMRQQLRVIGVDDEQLARVLRNIRALADWPYAWEAEGDRHAADQDWHAAVRSYYIAQRPLITPTALKRRLYRLVLDAYLREEHVPALEHLRIAASDGAMVAGYLQVPVTATRPAPAVVMVPGVTATKEELEVYAAPLVRRGYAVARIDSPGYGETTGRLDLAACANAAIVVETLRNDARIDATQVHLFGMSLGGHLALHAAAACEPASLVAIAPMCSPQNVLPGVPSSNIAAIGTMMGSDEWDRIRSLAEQFDLVERARRISCPVRIFHGGRDRTIPASESWKLVELLGGPVALTIYERDHHNCLEHFDEIIVRTLEWLEDPRPVLQQFERERAVRPQQSTSRSQRRPDSQTGMDSDTVGAAPEPEPGIA